MKLAANLARTHRDDIDGLRAVAILAVIFFHLGCPYSQGGFVGVDVFFVISGFLITGILKNEKNPGITSLYEFYSRRIRRIYPAMLLVIGVTLYFGYRILPLQEFGTLNTAAFWSAISLAKCRAS